MHAQEIWQNTDDLELQSLKFHSELPMPVGNIKDCQFCFHLHKWYWSYDNPIPIILILNIVCYISEDKGIIQKQAKIIINEQTWLTDK